MKLWICTRHPEDRGTKLADLGEAARPLLWSGEGRGSGGPVLLLALSSWNLQGRGPQASFLAQAGKRGQASQMWPQLQTMAPVPPEPAGLCPSMPTLGWLWPWRWQFCDLGQLRAPVLSSFSISLRPGSLGTQGGTQRLADQGGAGHGPHKGSCLQRVLPRTIGLLGGGGRMRRGHSGPL